MTMPTYIGLMKWTEQGIRKVKESTKRAKDFQELAAKVNVKVREVHWTMGRYDVIVVAEAPDDETISRLTLGLGMVGNVQAETLRAFCAQEVDKIVKGLT